MNLYERVALLGFVLHFFLFGSNALGHGMAKPGPHGGYIQMPGEFHTELVLEGNDRVKVYLLDVDLKNPTVLTSYVSVSIKRNEKETQVICSTKSDYFECAFLEGVRPKEGDKFIIRASRKGSFVGLALYSFPLKFANY